ncbi:hypothetical protein L6164_031129 [Bauhinia variegata]|uniref:Uncharacterized protein n=1 Tax=Bauhinia variegata TaxID=167791 RepID=A0ACB9LEN9_BAUVA|nr:hypothetical protein L6164_031129 [Bauhinia variegata]
MSLLNKLGFSSPRAPENTGSSIPQGPDNDLPAPGQEFAQFGAGCFWGVELAFQRVPGVTKTEGNDVGTQYRSGIYYYAPEQEKAAKESLEQQQKQSSRKIVREILPAKKFYHAEEYHQQYLEKGGRFGFKQSAAKGCNDPIRCYG